MQPYHIRDRDTVASMLHILNVFREDKLTAVRHIPVTAICIHGESLTAAKAVEHSVIKWMRVFDVHASHVVTDFVFTNIVDVAGSTSF